MTGTPIQNDLDDLRSLLSFLRLEPFSSRSVFEDHIVRPLRSDQDVDDSLRNLRLLLQHVCLRRTESLLDLPPPVIKEVPVLLSPEEKALYEVVLRDCQVEFDKIACSRSNRKRFGVLFATIMRLRRVCNHGNIIPEASGAVSSPTGYGPSPRGWVSSDDAECEFCSGSEDATRFALDGLDWCPACIRWLGDPEEVVSTDGTPSPSGAVTPFRGGPFLSQTSKSPDPYLAGRPFPGSTQCVDMVSSKLTAVVANIQSSGVDPTAKR